MENVVNNVKEIEDNNSVQSNRNINTRQEKSEDKINELTQKVIEIFGNNQITMRDVKNMSREQLNEIKNQLGMKQGYGNCKNELAINILKFISQSNVKIIESGILEILCDGFGFLRSHHNNYMSGPDDIYVSPNQIRRFGLKTGDKISGEIRSPKMGGNEKYFALSKVEKINDINYKESFDRVVFDSLTPIFPDERIKLEVPSQGKENLSCRLIDIVSPIGKGQRSLIVAPPRTGKTILMKNIIKSITENHPEIFIIVLLIGERPEEVTDMVKSVKGEVVSSTFDEPATRHVQLADLVIERAKRLVEGKKDVAIFLDSITRLARAYNAVSPPSGKVLSGGVDSNALHAPKRFFGAARNIEGGGSLTIIASALVDTGSRMDEVIFEEFKGTGNCEIVLDRKISDRKIYPAMDISKSGTRREDLLLSTVEINKMWVIKRMLNSMNTLEQTEFLISKLKNTATNTEFFKYMNSKNGAE